MDLYWAELLRQNMARLSFYRGDRKTGKADVEDHNEKRPQVDHRGHDASFGSFTDRLVHSA